MGKVSSSYASVTRGVSEQVPQDRLPGQHYEQVNMVSDPVKGLVRRHGSVTMDERVIASVVGDLTDTQKAYARNYREFTFFIGNTEYSMVYQSAERNSSDTLPFCFVLNKTTGKFLNVSYEGAAALEPWVFGGVSALATVGRYLIMASNQLGPGYSVDDRFAANLSNAVAEVRGGAYSRTFTIKVTKISDGSIVTATYTTMASSYPELLDTSDIPVKNPDGSTNTDYQKTVNDRVNNYNSAVNKWIGDAAASITPQNIASKLVESLVASGVAATAIGGTITLEGVSGVSANDGGDGSMFRSAYDEIDDVSKLTAIHKPGKVIRVRPTGASDPYYMVATGDNSSDSSWQTVTWKEGPAQLVTPGQVFALGAVSSDGTTFHIAADQATLGAAIGETVPGYEPSSAGDISASGAVPYFFGKRVTMLTVFMDRLVIVANGTVFMSRVGDYFNWFRQSMLTVQDDDPIEAYALGAEDDIISRCVTYNRDLFMFGKRKQYVVSGRTILTPQSVSIATAANEQEAMYAQPVVVGNLMYYSKYESAKNQAGPSPYAGRVNQFQLGLFQDTPETFCVSQQLVRYLRGRPIEFAVLSAPSALATRTDGNDSGLYVYSFVDQPGTQVRAWDSWSRWEWAAGVGRIIGLTSYESSLYVYMLRFDGTNTWVACEQFVLDSDLSVYPYMDALRPWAIEQSYITEANAASLGTVAVALANTTPRAWLGSPWAARSSFIGSLSSDDTQALYLGINYDSYVGLTSPYVRDQNQKAMVNGRLVVGQYTVSVVDTGGLEAILSTMQGDKAVLSFNGRRVGLSNNQVGRQPVSNATLQVPAGRANTEHKIAFHSRDWLPMSITAVEWVGQLFLNSRRV